MEPGTIFDVDAAEPLALMVRSRATPAAFGDARCHLFEYSCRGDRVPGRLLLPRDSRHPAPLILLQHGIGGSRESDYLDAAAPWVRGGAAVATIDFPLHGARKSAKMSERLRTYLDASAARQAFDDGVSALLWTEFARQSVLDLRRGLDALQSLGEIDAERVAYAGFSLGAMVGAVFCGADPRPRAAALALAGGGFLPHEVDPCEHIARLAPRPLLLVNALRDDVVPRAASEALFSAAGEPKRIEWFEAPHDRLPGEALKAMWLFLRDHLGIG